MRAFLKTQPKTEDDIKCHNDCMIRSVSIATDIPYCEVHKIMYAHGWRATRNKSDSNWESQITKTLTQLGFKYHKISCCSLQRWNINGYLGLFAEMYLFCLED